MSREPREMTPDELRDEFLDRVRAIVLHWANESREPTIQGKCDGVAFSILTLLDGCSDLPCVDLVFRPNDEDKQYHIDRGENWIEDGTTISDMLHEHYYQKKS
jgi:hypothetical protein